MTMSQTKMHGVELRRCIGGCIALFSGRRVRFTEKADRWEVRLVQMDPDQDVYRFRTLGEAVLFAKRSMGGAPTQPVASPDSTDESFAYIGDERDGVYCFAKRGPLGGWFASTLIDSDTGAFVMVGMLDEGAYATEDEARLAATDAAQEWCFENGVYFDDDGDWIDA